MTAGQTSAFELSDSSETAAARLALDQSPGSPQPLFRLCCLLLARQDPSANALLPLLEQFPRYSAGWQALGLTLLPLQPAAALVAFTRVQAAQDEVGMSSVAARCGQAAALAVLGRHAEAASAYAACEALAPGDAHLPHRRGAALRQAGDHGGARTAFARATALAPTSAQAWHSLGVACQDLNDHAAAAPAFRAALANRPDFHEAAFNLGVALQQCGRLDSALDAYAVVLRLCPGLFGRIAQALISGSSGQLWLSPAALRGELDARVRASGAERFPV